MSAEHISSYVGQARVEIHSAIKQLDLLLEHTPHNSNDWAPTRAVAIAAQRKLEQAQDDVATLTRWIS